MQYQVYNQENLAFFYFWLMFILNKMTFFLLMDPEMSSYSELTGFFFSNSVHQLSWLNNLTSWKFIM